MSETKNVFYFYDNIKIYIFTINVTVRFIIVRLDVFETLEVSSVSQLGGSSSMGGSCSSFPPLPGAATRLSVLFVTLLTPLFWWHLYKRALPC